MGETIERKVSTYRNLSERFAKDSNDYSQQYFRVYLIRLDQMTKYLLDKIEKKWGNEYPIFKLHKLCEDTYDRCVIIGTIFKDQKLKPSVLKQLAESKSVVPQPFAQHGTDEMDTLHLEDELQRYELIGCLDKKTLVTGVTCALLGKEDNGKFEVIDCIFAGYRPQVDRPIFEDDNFVVLLSGLDLINVQKYTLSLRLLISWINGFLGNIQNVDPTKITRIIMAGSSIQKSTDSMPRKFTLSTKSTFSSATIEAVKVLDSLLYELCQLIDVDLMPGENDPTNYCLPQKSFHHILLPNSIKYKSLHCVTNPYDCEISGMRFLGTSGQPIGNIMRYTDIAEPLDALESCLKWSHLAPSAPDTLSCFPFYTEDPFIIDECPHVLFAGNQSKFDTKIVTGEEGQAVRLICVPDFSESFSVCLLNLKNLDCVPFVFNNE